ncbi:MAG: hypothetical protein KC613_00390 [Myxococcales bacterium]|nr:hypothetical protein [Myxococcales bacterium]
MKAGRIALRLVAVAALCGLLGEAVARQWLTSPSAQMGDAELGWTWRPGATVANHKEGRARLHINARGLVDDELTPKGDRRRVIGLGNSFLEALQVDHAAQYPTLLEAALARPGQPGLDYVNAGRSAMGPPHYPLVSARLLDLQPDLWIVHLGEGDVLHLLGAQIQGGQVRPPPVAADRWKARVAPIIDRSALATYLMRRFKPLITRWLAPAGPAEPPLDDTTPQAAEVAVQRLTLILRELGDTAPVWVVHTPTLRYGVAGATEDLAPHEGRIYRAAAQAASARYVSAGPALVASYQRTGQPPVGFQNHTVGAGHLNAQGHQAVAEALQAPLRAWLEGRP